MQAVLPAPPGNPPSSQIGSQSHPQGAAGQGGGNIQASIAAAQAIAARHDLSRVVSS